MSGPSIAGVLSHRSPKLSVPTAQSSQLSASESPQTSGFASFGSEASRIPSLSSSGSPALHVSSTSMSDPSIAGLLSDSGPKLSVPTAQSSQLSASESPQT